MPVGGALFGNTSSRSQTKNLVEFRAGKMSLKGKMVHPDKRKGLLYLYQSDDGLIHFCWKDRQSGATEDDLIIFPDDCEYKKVPQCTTGRVFVLKFKLSSRKLFFWMQEPENDKDDEYCRRINEVMNNPPLPGSQRSGGVTPDGDFRNLLNMSQQQLMQLFGGVGQMGGLSSLLGTMSRSSSGQSTRSSSSTGPALTTTTATTTASTPATTTATVTPAATTTTASTPTTTTTSGGPAAPTAIQLRDLQTLLSGLNVPNPEGNQQRPVDLSAALTSESLESVVVSNPGLLQALQQHLPSVEEQSGTDQLRTTLQSPQFQQALSMFSAALQSGQLGPVVQQFQVGDEAVNAANQGNMEEFVKALQKAENKEDEKGDKEERKDEKKEKDKDDDEGMALD